ncbi:MAG TPA: AAA family ATPase [Aggregatilinea sp.]|uniref:ATP-dependent nuclease n=1 Tax=Aggregatilinea sp. TaxID=2806333 RepID=UPI002B5A0B0D|nr:AAA family ATPase [Aggregatilinea sp.]HML21886.1 AAA family ATPase [Aggregatilinea sp.]
MFFKSIEFNGLGPFPEATILDIEPDVTVLTGRNDVGKSFILHAIQLLCTSKPISEQDANLFHVHMGTKIWNENPNLNCTVTAVLTKKTSRFVESAQVGDEISIEFTLAPELYSSRIASHRRDRGVIASASKKFSHMPRAITYSSVYEIGNAIDLFNPNPVEEIFIRRAFGADAILKLNSSSESVQGIILRQAGRAISQHLSRILPLEMDMTVHFRLKESLLYVDLEDIYFTSTPLSFRGAGVRKVLSVVSQLLEIPKDQECVLLLDEPENGLHADAQHELRRFLEGLALSESIQIIYATHSPSMINPIRPRTLRLLERTGSNDSFAQYAVTRINNRPIHDNYLNIRNSLGIWPSDSLLYAPITVIVEGITEKLCIPYLL